MFQENYYGILWVFVKSIKVLTGDIIGFAGFEVWWMDLFLEKGHFITNKNIQ